VPSAESGPATTNITFAPVIIPASVALQLADVDPVVLVANQVPVDGRSIVVLPFSGDASLTGAYAASVDATATAIYDRLIQQLRAIPGLYVIEPSIAASYADSELLPEQIAMYLGVRAVVQGRLMSEGQDLSLGLRFTDAAGDGTAIDRSFAASAGQLEQIEEDITRSLLDALSIRRTAAADRTL
jgi:TolB-like protein